MKKWIILAVVLVAAAGAAWFFWIRNTSAQQQDAAKPTTGKVSKGAIRQTVACSGKIVSNLDVDIKCKASGEIIKLPFDISDKVKPGELLMELDPVDETRSLHQAELEYQASQSKLATSQQNLLIAQQTLETDRSRAESALKSAQVQATDNRAKADRMKQLKDKGLASQEDYDTAETVAVTAAVDLENAQVKMKELKTQEDALELKKQDVTLAKTAVEQDKVAVDIAQDRLTDTKVMSPLTVEAVVSDRQVQIGQIISSGVSNVGGGTTVMTISDLSRIFVVASVDESDIGKVALKQPAVVTADAFPGTKFRGNVDRIATRGVNVSNVVTFEVRIEITGEGKELLKPAMTANVEIVIGKKDDAILVPVEAVAKNNGKSLVSVVDDAGKTADREVTTGLNDGTKMEIVSGLTGDETIVLIRTDSSSKWSGQTRRDTQQPRMGFPMGGGGRR